LHYIVLCRKKINSTKKVEIESQIMLTRKEIESQIMLTRKEIESQIMLTRKEIERQIMLTKITLLPTIC